nr:hypothetical protein [Endozoicomonas sp.]
HQREHSTNQDNNVNVLKRKIISHDVNDRKIPKEKQISKIPTQYQADYITYKLKRAGQIYSESKFFCALYELKEFYDVNEGKFTPANVHTFAISTIIRPITQILHKAKKDDNNGKCIFDNQNKQLSVSSIYEFVKKIKTSNLHLLHSMATLAFAVGEKLQESDNRTDANHYLQLALSYLEPIKVTEQSIRTRIIIYQKLKNYKEIRKLTTLYLKNGPEINIPNNVFRKYKKHISENLIQALIHLNEYPLLRQLIIPVIGINETEALIGASQTPDNEAKKIAAEQKAHLNSFHLSKKEILDCFFYDTENAQPLRKIVSIILNKKNKVPYANLRCALDNIDHSWGQVAYKLSRACSEIETTDRTEIGLCLLRRLAYQGLFEKFASLVDELLMLHPRTDSETSKSFIKRCEDNRRLKVEINQTLYREGIYVKNYYTDLRNKYIEFEYQLRLTITNQRLFLSSGKQEPLDKKLRLQGCYNNHSRLMQDALNSLKKLWLQKFPHTVRTQTA